MKVIIHRHGGFAGMSETVAVTDAPEPAPATAGLSATVERIKRLCQEHRPEGADFVHYDLLIEDAGSQRADISFADDGSDKARKLVELVVALSAAGKKVSP